MLMLKRSVGEAFTLRIPADSGAQIIGVKITDILTRFDNRVMVAVDSAIRTVSSYKPESLIRIVVPNRSREQEVRVSLVHGDLCGHSVRFGISANKCVHVLRDELELGGGSNEQGK